MDFKLKGTFVDSEEALEETDKEIEKVVCDVLVGGGSGGKATVNRAHDLLTFAKVLTD